MTAAEAVVGAAAVAAVVVVGWRRWRRWRRWWPATKCASRWRWPATKAQAGGGGQRQNAQVDNTRADARTNNVRGTSVNNVNNVNVDRNVNVSGNNNCCNNGWDNDYHPVATAAAITATAAVIGSIVRSPPARLRAGELRRRGLPTMRKHVVCPAGVAVRRRRSTLLIVRGLPRPRLWGALSCCAGSNNL